MRRDRAARGVRVTATKSNPLESAQPADDPPITSSDTSARSCAHFSRSRARARDRRLRSQFSVRAAYAGAVAFSYRHIAFHTGLVTHRCFGHRCVNQAPTYRDQYRAQPRLAGMSRIPIVDLSIDYALLARSCGDR